MSEPILELSGLTKIYSGGLKALDDVDLTINRGEIFALLGPNGAGKTTLIGAVCGLVRPTSGTMRVGGNRKGIFTRDRQPKSAAFHLRKRWRGVAQ